MRVHKLVSRAAVTAVVVAGAAVASSTPAFAAHDDSHSAMTLYDPEHSCQAGKLDFVDYGPGAPGGGNNDDYLVVRDICADGDGVQARVYLNGVLLGSKYNGGGSGSSVVWDPFPSGNVKAKDVVRLEVSSVDGPTPTGGWNIGVTEFVSVDG